MTINASVLPEFSKQDIFSASIVKQQPMARHFLIVSILLPPLVRHCFGLSCLAREQAPAIKAKWGMLRCDTRFSQRGVQRRKFSWKLTFVIQHAVTVATAKIVIVANSVAVSAKLFFN